MAKVLLTVPDLRDRHYLLEMLIAEDIQKAWLVVRAFFFCLAEPEPNLFPCIKPLRS
jgi:hypothetical protein